ncbi:hypothetical protein J2Z79_001097 [Symbiobacterium terraclitae]|uniref:Uncharacterized protein n=1 Tax=Symbiobacterium terraclitae TaxID=557451 RepID=A0ABS4JQ88_9FIRM|nr:hypothetical protein [Symbiobacterium terraclitae]MBP2017712.1 hypothetical protein [Symbiobacterium terraclitae]
MAKKEGQPVHEGPMADRRGTGWREDAAKLEARDQERLENPMKTAPDNLTSVDKAHGIRAKSDEGTVYGQTGAAGGDGVRGED